MSAQPETKSRSILKSDWVITLTATLIGVFVALYLNEMVAGRKLNKVMETATENILSEVASNQEKVEKAVGSHEEFMVMLRFMANYVDQESSKLIAPTDSMRIFQRENPDRINLTDSTMIEPGIYEYKGDLNFDFSFPQIEISTVAWRTFQNSGIAPTINFDCLMYLQFTYNATDEIIEKNEQLIEFLMGTREMGDNYNIIIRHLQLLIDYERSILEVYKSSDEKLKECH